MEIMVWVLILIAPAVIVLLLFSAGCSRTPSESGALYVATGGEGRIYRVQKDGSAETLLASTETHILSLAVARDGRVYAGSAPEGLVYPWENEY